MGKAEAIIQNKCLTYLRGFHRVLRISDPARVGDSDCVACIYGFYIEIEFKKESGGIHADLQKIGQRQCEKAGGQYWVVHSLEELKSKIRLLKATKVKFKCE